MRRHSQPKRPTAADPTSEVDLKLVKELERQSIDEIRKLRSHERLDFRIQVEIRPGNASQAHEEPVMATTGASSFWRRSAISLFSSCVLSSATCLKVPV